VDFFTYGKVGNLSKSAANHYVNQKWIFSTSFLWKAPVEKSVEIVEKFGFSTGKPEFSQIAPLSKPCITKCIILSIIQQKTCYVTTDTPSVFEENPPNCSKAVVPDPLYCLLISKKRLYFCEKATNTAGVCLTAGWR